MKTFKVRRKRNTTFEVFKGYDDDQARVVCTENLSLLKEKEKLLTLQRDSKPNLQKVQKAIFKLKNN